MDEGGNREMKEGGREGEREKGDGGKGRERASYGCLFLF